MHCFEALGVGTRAWTRPHVLVWLMGVIIAIVESHGAKVTNCAWTLFFIELSKILETRATVRVFQPPPPRLHLKSSIVTQSEL